MITAILGIVTLVLWAGFELAFRRPGEAGMETHARCAAK